MVFFWSANYIIGKVALREFPPLLACGLRIVLAGLFMIPVYLLQLWGRLIACPGQGRLSACPTDQPWMMQDVPMLLCLGIFGVTGNQLCFLIGLSRTSVAHSALIIAVTPIFVLLLAAAMKQEQITLRKACGMAIAFAGVGILNLLPSQSGAPGSRPTLLGDFFIFLSAAAFSLFTVLGKKISLRLSSITVNTFIYVGGALVLAPLTIWQGRHFPFTRVSAAGWTSLVYMALFPSVICYLIYYYALSHISASRVSAFSYLQPVIATILAAIALRERVTLPLIAGGAVIFTGVILTERG